MTSPPARRRFTAQEIDAIAERLTEGGPVPAFVVRARRGLEQYSHDLAALEQFKAWLRQGLKECDSPVLPQVLDELRRLGL